MNSTRLILRSRAGFTLVSVMVAVGIFSLVGLGMASVMVNSAKSQADLSSAMDLMTVQDEIRRDLSNADLCMENIIGAQASVTTNTAYLPVKLPTGQILKDKTDLTGFSLDDVTLKVSNAKTVPSAIPGAQVLLANLSLESSSKRGFQFRERPMGSFAAVVDASGKVISCGVPEAVKACPAGQLAVSNGPNKLPSCQVYNDANVIRQIAMSVLPPPQIQYIYTGTSGGGGSGGSSTPPPASTPPTGGTTTASTPPPATGCSYDPRVCSLYQAIGRNPGAIDAAGAAYWLNELNSGKSLAQVQVTMQGIAQRANTSCQIAGLGSNAQDLLNGTPTQVAKYYSLVLPGTDLPQSILNVYAAYDRSALGATAIDRSAVTYWNGRVSAVGESAAAAEVRAIMEQNVTAGTIRRL